MKKYCVIILLALTAIIGCSQKQVEISNEFYDGVLADINDMKFEQAQEKINAELKTDSSSVWGKMAEGLLFESRLLYYDALAVFMKLNYEYPNFKQAYFKTFEILNQLGFHEDAAAVLKDYREFNGDDINSTILEGISQLNLENYESAEQKFTDVLESDYDYADKMNLLIAQSLYRRGVVDSAFNIYNNVTEKISASFDAYFEAAEFLNTAGYFDSSMVLSKMACQKQDGYYLNDVKHFFNALNLKYYYEARQVKNEFEQKGADSVLLIIMDYYIKETEGNQNQVRFAVNKYKSYDYTSFTSRMFELVASRMITSGLALLQESKVIESMPLDSIVCPKFSEFYNYAAFKLYSYAYDVRDLETMETFTEFRKSTRDATLARELERASVGLRDEAAKNLLELSTYHNNEPAWLVGIGDVFETPGWWKYEASENMYLKAINEFPNYRPAYKRLINSYIKQNKYERVLLLTERFAYFQNKNPYQNLAVVEVLLLNGKFQKAIELFKENYPYVAGCTEYLDKYVYILKKARQKEILDDMIEYIVENSGENVDVMKFTAKYYNKEKAYDKAFNQIQKAYQREPNDGDINAMYNFARYYAGNKQEALDAFEKCLLDYPRNPLVVSYYSNILAMENIDIKKAVNLARESISYSTGNPEQVTNLCAVYILFGRDDLSLGEARKAYRVHNSSPELNYYIGRALYVLKRKNYEVDAKEKLQTALDLGLDGELRVDAMNILKRL